MGGSIVGGLAVEPAQGLLCTCVIVGLARRVRSLLSCPPPGVAAWHMCGSAERVGTVLA